MSELNPKLLADLARLAARYEVADWERLLTLLDDQERRQQVRALLSELARVSSTRTRGTGARTKPTPSRLRSALAEIRADDPDRADLLEGIWFKLRSRELLPTLAAVRAFGEAMGAKHFESTRRDQAITELMEKLVTLPGDSLELRMRETIVADRQLGEEYEQWVRLILGRPLDTENT